MKAAKLCLMLFISIGCLFVFSDTARAGTTVIHVDTEEGGNITDTTGSIVNQNGALFWNGTKWVTNDTAAHMYFTDMRTGERLKNYTTTTIEGSTSGQVVSQDINEYVEGEGGTLTAIRSLYTYRVAGKTGGTFTYEAVQYEIVEPIGRHIILRSRGTGHGIHEAYFDIYCEDTVGGPITALRADPIWFNYSALSMVEALAQTSETDGLMGNLPTPNANYFLDRSGGSDMGGITFKIHTGTINCADTLTPNLLSSFPVSFSYEGMNTVSELFEIKFLPTLVSETYTNALLGTAGDSSVTMASGSTEISGSDNTWEIELSGGTLKGAVGDPISTDDISLSDLPEGLTWTAKNNGSNKILITVAGEAHGAINFRKTVSVIVRGSAVMESGAEASNAIDLYINPPTYTVMLSNEDGKLLKKINSQYGDKTWYEFMKGIQSTVSSYDVNQFVAMVEANPGSQCFTKKISDYNSNYNNSSYALAFSSDGSIQEVPIYDHSAYTFYEYAYADIGTARYVHADKITKLMTSWDNEGTTDLLVLEAWMPSGPQLSNLTISEGTLVPGFSPEQTQYTDSVANSVTSVTVTPTVSSPYATITVQGQAAASGSPSQAINLAVGENTIQVVVSNSEEGNGSSGPGAQNYTIIVTRAAAPSSGGGGGGSGLAIPIVVTSAASSLSDSSAVLNGEITARGGATITAYGFSYKPEGGNWTQVQAGTGDLLGSFSYSLSGLTANTEYIFKAYAINSQGTAYGQEKSFLLVKEKEVYLPGGKLVMRFYIDKYQYYVNDQEKTMDTVPIIYEDRTLLPIGYVAQYLGATVNWDSDESKITIVLNGQTIELWIGEGYAKVNGLSTPIDPGNPAVVPIIQAPGRSMLPLSFISEALGCTVDWNPDIQEIKVTYPK